MLDSDRDAAVKEALRHYEDIDALARTALARWRAISSLPVLLEQGPNSDGLAVRRFLDRGLSELEHTQPDAAELLRQRFQRQRPVKHLSTEKEIPSSTLYEHIDKAIAALSAILFRLEAEASSADAQHRQTLIASLPAPTYQRLVGCDHYLQAIEDALDAQGNRRQPIFLTGLGGIGKTSVAREALAGWLSQGKGMVQDVAWATVAQSPLSLTPRIQKPLQRYALDQILAELGQQLQVAANALPNNERRLQALRHRLVDAPAVVVIDNVETPDEVQLALTIVQHLTAVAQILVTSRYRIDYPTGLSLVLRELSQADAMTLLHMEARRLDIQKADAATLQRICATVGGNPHALKLVLAQLRYLPVERMLGAFSGHFTAQALFAHIYETGWSLLSAEAQQVLLGLWVLPPAGATWEGLRAAVEASGRPCDDDALGQIVYELSLLNLLQASAPPEPVYTLHRLTYHFLESKMDSLLEQDA